MGTNTAQLPARERILNAAARLFHRQGIAGTSVDQILGESSTGKGQFYHYFEGKHEVVEAVADGHTRAQVALLRDSLHATPGIRGIRDWIQGVLDDAVDTELVGGCPIASMALEVGETDPSLREKLAQAFDAQLELIADALRHEQTLGALAEEADADVLSMRILTSVQGGLLVATAMKEPAMLEEAARAAYRELDAVTQQQT